MKLLYTAIITAGIICHTSIVHAGGWTQPKGKGYFKLSEQVVSAESLFLADGTAIEIPTLSRYTTSLYGEFGLVDRLTLVGYIPFVQRLSLDLEGTDPATGLGDWDLGVRIGLLTKGATVVSLQVMAGLPLGDDKQEIGLFSGDGEFNQHISLQVGHSLYPAPAYLKGEIGYNNRKGDDDPEKDYADELRYSLEAGYTIAERIGISVWLRGVKALGRSDDDFHPRNDLQYLSFGPEVNFYITPNAGITAGLSKFTSGRNMLDAPAWDFGFFLKL